MVRCYLVSTGILLAAINSCTYVGASPLSPTRILIRAEQGGWGVVSTNLTLRLTNGVYAAGTYTVDPSLVSHLMTVAKHPWPLAATNTWPRVIIDPVNLGLNAAWVKTNHQSLLQAFSGNTEQGVFPNASERQRAWLTQAIADLQCLNEAVRGYYRSSWSDDYPSVELRFQQDNEQIVEQVFRLRTDAQHSFMLPWEVWDGTNVCASGNADISRAVVQLLPPGFMNRDRLSGDLFGMIVREFPGLTKVQDLIKKSTLEETLGDEADQLLQGFELRSYWTPAGSYNRFPSTFMVTLHRTNWPERFVMPLQTEIERGVVTSLKSILGSAEARVAPLLKQQWLVSPLNRSANLELSVQAQGSPDHQWLRGHMDKVGRAAFYDRIQPALRRSLGFLLREGVHRSSNWALLDDGRLLLYGFTGDGVLDWSPDELGFRGDSRMLQSSTIKSVGVFVGPDGKIAEVVPPE